MISEFDEAMAEAIGEAIAFIGTTEFFISGRRYTGDLSELGNNAFAIVIGGKEVLVTATLIAPLAQFGDALPGAESRLKCKGKAYRVASFSSDTISLHLQLASADSH